MAEVFATVRNISKIVVSVFDLEEANGVVAVSQYEVNRAIADVRPFFNTGGQMVTFISLTDTPASYSGQGGKILKIKLDESGVEFASGASSGVDSFNGRTGIVTPQTNDYNADQIDDTSTTNKFATQTQLNQIATNTSNISNNTVAIAANASDIGDAETSIASNSSAISANASNIATNTSNIASNASAISANASNIATNTSNIADRTIGPVSSTDNAIARYDGATGKILQNSGATVDDSGNVSAANITATGQIGSTIVDDGNSGTAKTIDFSSGNVHFVDLTDNVTFTLDNPISGFAYSIILKQDATGSRIVTWPASVKWPSGTAPTLSTAANSIDIITLIYNGLDGEYYGASNLNFS